MSEFLHMGGYGFYVWGAYSVTLALLLAETVLLRANERGTLAQLGRELQRDEAR